MVKEQSRAQNKQSTNFHSSSTFPSNSYFTHRHLQTFLLIYSLPSIHYGVAKMLLICPLGPMCPDMCLLAHCHSHRWRTFVSSVTGGLLLCTQHLPNWKPRLKNSKARHMAYAMDPNYIATTGHFDFFALICFNEFLVVVKQLYPCQTWMWRFLSQINKKCLCPAYYSGAGEEWN